MRCVWSANSHRSLSGWLLPWPCEMVVCRLQRRSNAARPGTSRCRAGGGVSAASEKVPAAVGCVCRASIACVKRDYCTGGSRASSHPPAVLFIIIQGAVRRGKRAVWLQSGISLSMNTAQPPCLPTRDGAVETANACQALLGRRWSLACLLACLLRAPRSGEARRVVLGRMVEVSRKKMRWPALGECHARVLRSTWLKIRRLLVFTQHRTVDT